MTHGYLIDARTRTGGLEVDTAQIEDTMEFVLSGELDLSNASALRDVITRALDNRERMDAPLDRLIIDLRALCFIDSCGIQALISAKQRCADCGTQLSLRLGADSQVMRVLQLAGVARLLGLQ